MGLTTDGDERPRSPTLSIRQAAFIGVGAMVEAHPPARARAGVRLMIAEGSTWSMV